MPSSMPSVKLLAAAFSDRDFLASIRVAAMRESLERIGRFDPVRARERFAAGYSPEYTRHVVVAGERVGFIVVRPNEQGLLLDHLYLQPGHQGRGFGAAVLKQVFSEADVAGKSIRVGALKESRANQFYIRHGFVFLEAGEWDNYYVRQPRSAP